MNPAARCLLGAAALALLTACTPAATGGQLSTSAPAPSPSTARPTSAKPSPTSTAPVTAGATTTAEASCPFIDQNTAANDLGQRLDHSNVLTSGGKPVGCDFFPVDDYYSQTEHLPPRTVSALRIRVMTYRNTTIAHNAMVLLAKGDPSAYQDPITGADEAISFAETFFAPDGNQDRAFTFRKGTTVVLVQIAQTKVAISARQLGMDIVGKV